MSLMIVVAKSIPFTKTFLAHKDIVKIPEVYKVQSPIAEFRAPSESAQEKGARKPVGKHQEVLTLNIEAPIVVESKCTVVVITELASFGLTLKNLTSCLLLGGFHVSSLWQVLAIQGHSRGMFPSAQGIMMARRMLRGAPLACSSHTLSQSLVQSLRDFVTVHASHEHLPSPSVATLRLPQRSVRARPFCNFSTNHYAASTCQLLQPALWRGIPRSLLENHRNSDRVWRAVGISEFSTDAAPAADVTPEDVLHFWFKDADLAKNEFPMKFWFMGGEAADEEIKEKFGDCLECAIQGKLDHWKSTPRGRVALVLVLDQFSRNCHRDSSRAFAQDETALKITLDSVEQGLDLQLSNPLEQYFLYMPLMHCEAPEVHVEAQRLFQKLADEHKDNPELHKMLLYVVKFEKAHSAILTKFGRYPSRNSLLGRKNTPREEEYLASGVIWPIED